MVSRLGALGFRVCAFTFSGLGLRALGSSVVLKLPGVCEVGFILPFW